MINLISDIIASNIIQVINNNVSSYHDMMTTYSQLLAIISHALTGINNLQDTVIQVGHVMFEHEASPRVACQKKLHVMSSNVII